MPWVRTYFLYLMQRTLVGVLGLFALIWLLVVSVDLVEAMREVGKIEGAGLPDAVKMTLFRTPQLVLTLSPFVFLFGTLWAFGQMAKTSEVSVMRSAGLSVWRLVAAPLVLSAGIGLITVIVIDPFASSLASRAQMIKNEVRGKEANILTPFQDGIWLRQTTERAASIIRAEAYDPKSAMIYNITVWRSSPDGVFIDRWDAASADVRPDHFRLRNARRTTLPGDVDGDYKFYEIPVEIDIRTLREDIAKPTSLSVWQLPGFTRMMESAGMSTISYELRYHNLWSLPLKLSAMVLIACSFALGMNSRAGGTATLMGIGIAIGFGLFILSELSSAIAEARIVSVSLAAWAPGILAVLLALTLLLYREDG